MVGYIESDMWFTLLFRTECFVMFKVVLYILASPACFNNCFHNSFTQSGHGDPLIASMSRVGVDISSTDTGRHVHGSVTRPRVQGKLYPWSQGRRGPLISRHGTPCPPRRGVPEGCRGNTEFSSGYFELV